MKLVEDHDGVTYRAAYTVTFEDAVYMLDVFQKKANTGRSTPKHVKERCEPGSRLPRWITSAGSEGEMSEEMKVHEGSGNVFTDTASRDAEERVAKADLARAIRKEFKERAGISVELVESLVHV